MTPGTTKLPHKALALLARRQPVWHAGRRVVEQYLGGLGVEPADVAAAVTPRPGDALAVDTLHPVWRRHVRRRDPNAPVAERWTDALRLAYDPTATAVEFDAELVRLAGDHADRRRQLARRRRTHPLDAADVTGRAAWLLALRNDVNKGIGHRTMTSDQAGQVYAPVPPPDAKPAIWVAGYPGLVGGAGPELWHMIRLWRRHGVDVHLVPMGTNGMAGADKRVRAYEPDAAMRKACDALGCWTHAYRPDVFRGRTVASWCNEGFLLALLHDIATADRPRQTLWANCMTWTFPAEREAHAAGLIDTFLFQSDYQRRAIVPQLEAAGGPVHELAGFRPHFDVNDTLQGIRFHYRDPADAGHFAAGRISRNDPAKFTADCWQTFAAVRSPLPAKAYVLGYDAKVEARTGKPPASLDWQHWPAGGVTAASVLSRLHCMIHQVGESRENWPRVVLEAMAAGVPVIAQRAYGTAEMIEDGVTGFLCDTGPEMAARASELAADEPRRRAMIFAARERLDALAGDLACWRAWDFPPFTVQDIG